MWKENSELPTEYELDIMEMEASQEPLSFFYEEYVDAFSHSSRLKILKRDNYTCQKTGKHFERDGVMVHAAHYDHTRGPGYDNPENGRCLSVEAHLEEHIDLYWQRKDSWSIEALRLLANVAYHQGLHTRKYYQKHPFALWNDRRRVHQILRSRRIDPVTLIHS
jgi:hypothetical protein